MMDLRQLPMTMQDWEFRFNRFIEATDREILQEAGKVTAEIAKADAESEFELRIIFEYSGESVPLIPVCSSGYTGTIRASAYNHAAGATQFGYIITGAFSSTYWADKAFPSTIFFLESCHGADPGALPGMPTWTTNHGASVWVGWNESVSFNCGDNGTDLFFQKMKEQKTVTEAVDAVYATGCRPPEHQGRMPTGCLEHRS